MGGFGWMVGIDPCEHLGDADTAAFACVLGMPWARTAEVWSPDPADAPTLTQAECAAGFGDWLVPWKHAAVTWQLWAWDGRAAAWKRMSTAASKPVAYAPLADHAQRLRARCVDRLDALVAGHTDAMSFMVQGQRGERLSYPVVSPGVALKPAALSEQVLGASCVLYVARPDLPAQDGSVVALPVFAFADGPLAPSGGPATPGGDLCFAYGAPPATRIAKGVPYQFSGCVTRSVIVPRLHPDVVPTFVRIGGGLPDSQTRATLSREFYPLKLWLDAIDKATIKEMTAREFVARLVRLVGGGEDELAMGKVVGSVYELILTHDEYGQVFDVRDNAKRAEKAEELNRTFDTRLVADAASGAWCAGRMVALYQLLQEFGLDESTAHSDALTQGAESASPATREMLEAARALQALLSSQSVVSCAAWCCWFAVLTPELLPASPTRDALAQRLVGSAREALKNASATSCPVLPDDVLRLMNGQIDRATGFWEAVHAATDLATQLPARKTDFVSALSARLGLTAALAPSFERSYDDAVKRLLNALPKDAPEADDSPLRLYYRASATPPDERIRGCILALRAGAPDGASGVDWKAGQWLTNFHAALPVGNTAPEIVQDAAGDKLVFCDTQGGTMSDGLQEQACAYGGEALLAAPVQGEGIGTDAVFIPVPTGDRLPRLAFGTYYGGVCGTVDNAGAILESVLRQPLAPGQPVTALDADWFPDLTDAHCYRYLSCQPPGLPTFAGADDWGVGAETLAFERLETDRTHFKAAVLFDGTDFKASCPRQELRLLAPSVSPSFMARWLDADRLVAAGNAFRWDRVMNLTDVQLNHLIATAEAASVKRVPGQRSSLGLSHPAVSFLRVVITWYSELGQVLTIEPQIDLPLRHLNGSDWIRDESFVVTVQRVQALVERKVTSTGDRLVIAVPKGMRARVEVRSVVASKHLVGEFARLQRSVMLDKADAAFVDSGVVFESRLAESLWVESLPACTGHADRRDFSVADFELVVPMTATAAPEMTLRFKGDLPATWLRGFAIEQKRWQWSGYPIDFPQKPDLESWLALYAGTTNEAPALPAATFSTTVVPSGWRIAGILMKPVPLAASRPALHMGVELTPLLRFAKLLKASLRSRSTTFLYDTLPATPRALADRMPPPVLDEAIPLPQTSSSSTPVGAGLGHGNLLVLHDPVYDTADSAPFGGIAERIELDVMGTWQEPAAGVSALPAPILEAGPNPIFHGNAPRLTDLEFALEAPFGLAYDLGVGGRPAQTGLIVRPRNAQGRWVMAKCRLRRVELPDHVIDSSLGDGSDGIGWRAVEDAWAPQDFAVYTGKPLGSLRVGGAALKLPVFDGDFARCYLVSWHKGRWASATPTWRAQVNLCERTAGTASWSLRQQVGCFGQDDFAPTVSAPARLGLQVGAAATVHAVRVSDYTEARWLSFIGSFGLDDAPVASNFQLRTDGSSFVLELAPKKNARLPVLTPHDQPCASMLLVYTPGRDLMRGNIAQEGGELIGVYGFSAAGRGNPSRFDRPMLAVRERDKIDWRNCYGVVIQLQRVDTSAPLVPDATSWAQFVGQLFPDENPATSPQSEASLRFLPEYLAPLDILTT